MPTPLKPSADDKDMIAAGTPYIRSVLAFIIYVRYDAATIESSYTQADKFLTQLKSDMED
jgi:hypothetical protein